MGDADRCTVALLHCYCVIMLLIHFGRVAECRSACNQHHYWILRALSGVALLYRLQIFGTYRDALRKIEDADRQSAAAGFKVCVLALAA